MIPKSLIQSGSKLRPQSEALYKYPSLLGVCADAGYRGTFVHYVQLALTCLVEIVQRLPAGWTIFTQAVDCRKNARLAQSL
jgi:hypothetical protein